MNLDPDLLEILACPSCHAPVRPDEAASTLDCTGCGLRYPVRDDIPVMLIDEALPPVQGFAPSPGSGPSGSGPSESGAPSA